MNSRLYWLAALIAISALAALVATGRADHFGCHVHGEQAYHCH